MDWMVGYYDELFQARRALRARKRLSKWRKINQVLSYALFLIIFTVMWAGICISVSLVPVFVL